MSTQKGNEQANMSLVGHLREIRNRIALSVVALLAAFVICFAIIKPLANAMLQMGLDAGFQYVYLSPSELLTSYFKLALVLAVVVVSPLLIFQIWGFVAPALTKKEKRAIRPALLGGFFFFCLGALFSYMVALPFMIQFLVNFSTSDFIHSAISVASYLDFMIGMLLTFGVVFEEPMLAFVLTKLGILTPDILRKVRRYAIPLIFVIAAIITPPDVVSQFMVAVPMIGLYELSILISCVIYKKKQNEDDDEDEDEDDDEYDEEEEIIDKIDDNIYLVDGDVDLDDLDEELGIELVSETSETIGGFIIDMLGEIPDENDVGRIVEFENYQFKIMAIQDRRIERVKIYILPKETEENSASESDEEE